MRMEAIAPPLVHLPTARPAHTSDVALALKGFRTALGRTLRLPDEDVVQYTLVQSQ